MTAGKDDMGGTAANRITSGGSGITGTTLGASGGAQTQALAQANLPNVQLSATNVWNTAVGGDSVNYIVSGGYTNADAPSNWGSVANQPKYSLGGTDTPHNNTQPTIIMNTIIKA